MDGTVESMSTSSHSPGPVRHDPLSAPAAAPVRRGRRSTQAGFTAVEILIVVAIILVIVSVAIPIYKTDADQARTSRAAAEIKVLEDAITLYIGNNGFMPTDLSQVGYGNFLDPWGRPYAFLNHVTNTGNGIVRTDRFNVNLNSDYDLYCAGIDGLAAQPITDPTSLDDIIRANNGAYVGPAANY